MLSRLVPLWVSPLLYCLLSWVRVVLYGQKHRRITAAQSMAINDRTCTYITTKPAMLVNTTSSSGADAKLTLSTWWLSASPANNAIKGNKGKGGVYFLRSEPPQSFGARPAIWGHTANAPCLNPSQIGRYSIYPEGWKAELT